jgi:dihydrofolate synthase/folylpolyglutamate synthase
LNVRYARAIERLYALSARGMRVGIERMQAGLAFRGLGPAELRVPFIQVAGTNGKGSVSAMIEAGLRAAGYRTGLYTSPHLHRFTERVRIDGQPLHAREAARRITELLAWAERSGAPELSFFEIGTLLAVEAFRDHRCDVAVIEVGLGGRLDATTALPATLSIITRIAKDHEQMLGDTLTKIAAEKAGIIRANVPVIVGSPGAAVQRVILAQARRLRAPVSLIERDFRVLPSRGGRVAFEVQGRRIAGVTLGLGGDYQHENAAIAAAALCALETRGLPVPSSAIRAGLAQARWPARLERYAGDRSAPDLLFDAAHNPDGCAALARYLQKEPARPRVLIFGVMADKDYPQMLRLLAPHVEQVLYVEPQLPRAARAEQLQRCLPGVAARDARTALRRAKAAAGSSGLVICAGSIFAVAELRARALKLPSDPLIRM